MNKNPINLNGIDFLEFSTNKPNEMHEMFIELGFSKVGKHKDKNIDLYTQGGIVFMLNYQESSFGDKFQKLHGPSVSSMGWRVKKGEESYTEAVKRGAKGSLEGDYSLKEGNALPSVYGIGESLIYLVEPDEKGNFSYERFGFEKLQDPVRGKDKGFLLIDHLTNNVYNGTMNDWAAFYKDIFGFTEVRYFDIKGKKTGLVSFALKSPCGLFSIPINEAKEEKSQINEYLDEYKGPGVQHIAFLTKDLISSVAALKETSIETLDINASYYEEVFNRVPNVTEDKQKIQDLDILVDGDEEGYLLQIFTKNLVGPIFIEFIQRKNHLSFGEGNFQALFESIERDQERRGVL